MHVTESSQKESLISSVAGSLTRQPGLAKKDAAAIERFVRDGPWPMLIGSRGQPPCRDLRASCGGERGTFEFEDVARSGTNTWRVRARCQGDGRT